jgi:lipoprotein-releasing system permease protein
MSRVSWIIAKRYFKSKKHDGFVSLMSGFSMIGIALGVATLIVVMAVMTGLKDDLLDRILGFRGHLNINPTHVELKNYETLTESLKQYPFVKSAIPLVDQPSIVTVNNHFTGAIIHGLNFKELKAESMVGHKVIRGAIF